MAKSNEGLTVKKENFSEWYSQVIEKAEIVDLRLGIKGFITIRPWGAMLMENMFHFYEKELQKKGHLPVIMPTVIPESNLKKESSHIQGFTPEVFWLESQKGEEKFALRPTSETVFTPMFALWIRSHRDLPMKLYQKGSVFRYDTKATRPLIRGREFWWIECHDAFATKEEAINQTIEDIDTTEKIMHQKFGIPFLPMKRPEWDKFAGAEYTIGSDVFMPDGRLIQQPSTHLMGQKFSRAFNATFKDEGGKENYLYTTAYGPAISRILVSVISTHGDDKGLVIPYCISPVKVVIVPIYDSKNKVKVLKYCEEISSNLNKLDIPNWLNNKEGYSPGWKFHEAELKGIPFRLEIGEKEMKTKSITLFTRDTEKKGKLPAKSLGKIKELGKQFDDRLRKKADKLMDNKIVNCKTKEEIKKTLNSGKIARVNFCSIDKNGEKCAEHIEKEFGAEVRGTMADKNEKASGKCVICNTKAEEVVYIGRSY
ncbi:proline--tRNA ligase [Candidatus Pacearchaeota archaeon RBG_16_35_8]|nr:MAG: proline--tRNA ligase [Candidatus Pacearchaeota archaeon RBG_16_35_8]